MFIKKYHKFHDGRFGSAITVRVIPRASKNEISAVMADGTLKIKLTAPPVEGQANQALVEFLSETLGITKSKIEIVSGSTSRKKLIAIEGVEAETLQKLIVEKLA